MIKHIIIFLFSTLLICQDSYLGDLNFDNNVDVIDIVQLVDIILGTTPTDQQLLNGDVNEDFVLNIQDIVIIINIILDQLCPTYQNQCDPSTLGCCSSHDIEFEVNTFGDYSNDIYDSWIFSNDHILAVGELFVVDEGNFSGAIWNGETWEIIQLIDEIYNVPIPVRGIWAFSPEDVYLASGSILHWNGNSDYIVTRGWTLDYENYPNEGVFEVWAASSNSIYFVGPGGGIRHFNGEEFIRMESGTNIWLKDVWGYVNPDTGEETVWVSGWNDMGENTLLVYRGDEWEPVYDVQNLFWEYLYDHLSGGINSVWATDNYLYVLTTNGLYQCSHDTQGEAILILESEWYVDYRYQVRGVDDNDIFVVGYNSEIMHYNGDTWEQINYFEGDYLDNIQVTENTVIVGGHRFEGGASVRALLLHGTRGE